MGNLKFGDGEGPNLCRVKNQMLVPHLLKTQREKSLNEKANLPI